MKKLSVLFLSFAALVFTGCSEDDEKSSGSSNSVSFANPSLYIAEGSSQVQLLFSKAVKGGGTITLNYTTTNVAYGTDFTTIPGAEGNAIEIPFEAGATEVTFTFNKLLPAGDGETKNVKFSITDVSVNAAITGNSSIQVNLNEAPSLGAAIAAEVGGANQPNQVYVDLTSGMMRMAERVSWDLGFYSGDQFRVALNSSLRMSAKQLNTTDINAVVAPDESMLIGQGNGDASQIDHPAGDISQTAIAEVSDNDADNKVYLINLGNGPSASTPSSGTEGSSAGPHRGWKKIRILKSGSDYKLQYADINATTHQEVILSKNNAYNFVFFSFTANSTVQVEPQANQWDINFTTFTNVIEMPGAAIPYYYPDFIVTNTKGGARSYMVLTEDFTYDNFTLANVDDSKFTNDQRNIGSNWRSTSVMGPGGIPVSQFVLKTDRFFIVKDPMGNIYKLRMTGGASESGERGFPKFQYALLQ
ncbi:HmuY family protein [Flavobacterium sp. MK4S-17]|uniref:HmuY family protein n=1 Tax=Flavobacterium sp. MK4S-17 TaxID=2543737 RepID=UPI0013568DC0|nr:HmuY family protein [Flavobacterium sp. MK4S-17]